MMLLTAFALLECILAAFAKQKIQAARDAAAKKLDLELGANSSPGRRARPLPRATESSGCRLGCSCWASSTRSLSGSFRASSSATPASRSPAGARAARTVERSDLRLLRVRLHPVRRCAGAVRQDGRRQPGPAPALSALPPARRRASRRTRPSSGRRTRRLRGRRRRVRAGERDVNATKARGDLG